MSINALTYTTVGSFDQNGYFALAAYLPDLTGSNQYYYEQKFDLSLKDKNGNQLNVLLIALRLDGDNGYDLDWNNHPLKSVPTFNTFDNTYTTSAFDKKNEAVVLVYHDNDFDAPNDIPKLITELEDLYTDTVNNGPHNTVWVPFVPHAAQPKRLGMSLIKKF